jgi:hypothetical protein
MTGPQIALALAAAFIIGLAVGAPIGAWPDRVLRERDSARAELTQARSDLTHQSDLHLTALRRLHDLDRYGETYFSCLEECDCTTCADPFCPCQCHK